MHYRAKQDNNNFSSYLRRLRAMMNVDSLDKSSSADNKWQDGLRRDENDKV